MRMEWLRRALAVMGCCVMFAGVSACGGGGGGGGGGLPILPPTAGPAPQQPAPAPAPAPAATDRVVSESIQSGFTGAPYPLAIYLPAGYDQGTDAYPVIYALDGDAVNGLPQSRFENLKDILVKRGTKAILVGIGNAARRQEDYNFPGAFKYHDFLAKELIPFIDSKYRTNPKNRMLTGLSTSGNLAATALFLEAPDNLVFSSFVSIEGAFWQQEAQNNDLEQKMFDALAGRPLPVTLILASCADGCNQPYVKQLYQRMAARNYAGLLLLNPEFSTTHVGADVLAFEDAVVRIYK